MRLNPGSRSACVLQLLGDRDREVTKEHVLVLRARPRRVVTCNAHETISTARDDQTPSGARALTSEERLHLDAADAARVRVREHEARDGEHALPVHEQLELAVLRAGVVEAHALADRRARAGRERERAAPDGLPERVVAVRLGRHRAHLRVRVDAWRQVRVQLARALAPPHEPRGETALVAPPARA